MKYLLILAMVAVAIILIGTLGFLLWLAIDAICARVLRFPRWY
jgi:preprotein translocase subunit Sss1